MTRNPHPILILGILFAAASAPAAAQDTAARDLCRLEFQGQCCIGPNCGEALTDPSGDGPTFHCHSVNARGEQCWDADPGSGTVDPDGSPITEICNLIPGFNLQPSFSEVPLNVQQEAAISCEEAGVGGATADHLLVGVGGYDIFRSQIRRTARPRMVRDADRDRAQESAGAGGAHFSEMTTSVELSSWELRGIGGETPGGRFAWRRQSESGHLLGLAASYQDAEPDFGEPSELLNASFSYGHTLGPVWSWSVSGTYSDLRGGLDDTLLGASGLLGFSNYSERGTVVSGGVILQYLDSDRQPDDLQTAGYGVAFGFPVGRRLAIDLEGYGVSILDGDIRILDGEPVDDTFFTVAGMLSIYATPRFAVTLGYRTLEGLDELDSESFTFGASTRWQ